MIHMVMFTTRDELAELTGIQRDEYDSALWHAGFDLDDWDVGFQMDKPIHNEAVTEDGYVVLEADWNSEGYWLAARMENYWGNFTYTKFKGKHYYLVHHA